jgi:hypothetical protein
MIGDKVELLLLVGDVLSTSRACFIGSIKSNSF